MKPRILSIVSSLNPASSTSRQLAREAEILATGGELSAEIVIRDTSEALPPIDAEWVAAAYTPQEQRNPVQQQKLSLSDQLIDELKLADQIIIATPMYNFSIPAGLKAWIDHVARAGVTFRYTEQGPEGLLPGKPVTLIVSTGGVPVDSAMDFVTPYLRQVLGFIGLTDIRVVAADQMNVSPEASLEKARVALQEQANPSTLAA